MFNDISCGTKDNEEEFLANARLVSLYARRFGKRTMGHSLVLVPKRYGILWKRIAHKEFGITSRKKCCWNSQKADIQFSVLRLHCPEANSKAKDMVNCRYTLQPTRKRLRLFFAKLFLQTSSVFTEQSQRYVKSMSLFTKERGNLLWWDNQVPQSCSVRSRQKFLWIVMTQRKKIFYGNNKKNELRSCHNKTNWVNSVWMQDFWVLLRMDSISRRKTLEISHNIMQWTVVNTLFLEKKQHHNPKYGSKDTLKLGPCWKLQPVICTANMELRSDLCLWAETTLTPGSEFLTDQISLGWIWTTMARIICAKTECKRCCMPIEGKSKTTKKRTCWFFTKNRSHWKKE